MTTHSALLAEMARRYVHWKTPDEALRHPARIVRRVMELGDYEDVFAVVHALGEDAMREILKTSGAGELSPRSWHYWHYRLHLARTPDEVPPVPQRRLPS